MAVKVQRPDMLRRVTLDLFLIRGYFHIVERTKGFLMRHGFLRKRRKFDLPMFDAFAAASLLELDYRNEASNQEFFKRELNKRMAGDVYVPEVYHEASSDKVLCMEWITGTPLATSSPDEIKRLVPVGVECFLIQLLELGRFHSDPHPGNLLVEDTVSPSCPSGRRRLVLLDFGLCAKIQR